MPVITPFVVSALTTHHFTLDSLIVLLRDPWSCVFHRPLYGLIPICEYLLWHPPLVHGHFRLQLRRYILREALFDALGRAGVPPVLISVFLL